MSLTKAVRGLRAAVQPRATGLADEVAAALSASTVPIRLLIAEEDATAIAFQAEYRGRTFAPLRRSGRAKCLTLASRSHSFATPAEADWLARTVIAALDEFDAA
jgi:hypothetical protein